jgi:hypothetical protein
MRGASFLKARELGRPLGMATSDLTHANHDSEINFIVFKIIKAGGVVIASYPKILISF